MNHPPVWPSGPAPATPMELFAAWFQQAREQQVPGPRAMVLATATPQTLPSQRVVILREYGQTGLIFVSSSASRKGVELAANPQASGHFHWPSVNRQISFTGLVEVLTSAESEALFSQRSPQAKAVAVGSQQSAPLLDPRQLHRTVELLAADGSRLQRPDSQVGYRLNPGSVEFWSGNDDELHDRLRFERINGAWTSVRLQP